jgi:hypothetical protein
MLLLLNVLELELCVRSFCDGQFVNLHFCVYIMWHLQEEIQQKCPGMWHTGDWFLHHDGASTHCFVLQEVWPDTA